MMERFDLLVSSRNVMHADSGRRVGTGRSYHMLVASCGTRISGGASGVGDWGLWDWRDYKGAGRLLRADGTFAHVKVCDRCFVAEAV